MASVPTSTNDKPARFALLIAGGFGIVAAMIILWVVGSIPLAATFLATTLVLSSALLVFRRLFPATTLVTTEPDWSVARALAESSADAIAVTDRAGRLVCANDQYEAIFLGFPTPPGLPFDASGVERLSAAGRVAPC
jgi:two-component system cell cycle sensor histidine kinase/response regulator CckA